MQLFIVNNQLVNVENNLFKFKKQQMEDINMISGKTVKLNSGSPKMTINRCMRPNVWECTWFNGNELCKGEFSAQALTEVKEGEDEKQIHGGNRKSQNNY